jgi:hypothetical protein
MIKKTETVKEDMTPAQASLTPASHPTGQDLDPTRNAMMAYAIQVMGGLEKGDLSRFLESLAQIGQETAVLPPTADANANLSTIAAKPSDAVKEDVALLFAGEDLTEDFKNKAASLVEDAVAVRVALEKVKLDEEYTKNLEEAYKKVTEIEEEFETKLVEACENYEKELSEKVDEYLNYVATEWMKENEIAIEAGIKTEMTESFMEGLKNLLTEHYIDIPEDKVDVLSNLSSKVEELEAKLNESVNEVIELKKEALNVQKGSIVAELAEGLLATEQEKFKTLSESIDFNGDTESFKKRLAVVKENYFKKTVTSVINDTVITEDVAYTEDGKLVETIAEEIKPTVLEPVMNKYVSAISRGKKL